MFNKKEKQKVHLITYGCSLNINDSEQIIDSIDKEKYELTEEEKDANIIIINSCTVKTPTDNKIFNKIKCLKKQDKRVVLTGCLVQAQEDVIINNPLLNNVSLLGTSNFKEINNILDNSKSIVINKEKLPILKSFRFEQNRLILPISRGCLGNCSYCLTKKARGNLYSYSPDEIINEIYKGLNNGVKEIWLTSEDTFVYGLDKGYKLSNLLERISVIDRDFIVRLGMGNPKGYLLQKEEIIKSIEIMKYSNKFYRFLHIPIQSASNRVLKLMNRGYTKKELSELFNLINKNDFLISTDIICGFPSETDFEFNESIEFIKKFEVSILNVSRFWPRPGTIASEMKYDGRITKKRSKQIKEIHDKISKKLYDSLINTKQEVIVNEISNDALLCRDSKYRLYVILLNEFANSNLYQKYNVNLNDKNSLKKSFLSKKFLIKTYQAKTHYIYARVLKEIK